MDFLLRYLLPALPTLFTALFAAIRKTKNSAQDKKRAEIVEGSPEFVHDPNVVVPILEISQCRDLARHPTRTWKRRELSDITQIVLHHTATDYERSNWGGIAKYATTPSPDNHLSPEGAPYVPYHFGIDLTGCYQFNDLEDITWSVLGYNRQSVNISVLGDFSTVKSHDGKNRLMPTHENLIRLLVAELKAQFPTAKVTTHRDLGKLNCPGDEIRQVVQSINEGK
jgi:hypothetical protein